MSGAVPVICQVYGDPEQPVTHVSCLGGCGRDLCLPDAVRNAVVKVDRAPVPLCAICYVHLTRAMDQRSRGHV